MINIKEFFFFFRNTKRAVKRHHRRIIWWSLFVIGAIAIAFSFYLYIAPVANYLPLETLTQNKKLTMEKPPELTAPKDFGLIIPKIMAALPIIPDVDGGNEEVYLQALQRGIAQLKGSSKPNESGNVFIFGHSSDWRWHPGDYKKAFERLPEVAVGDEITVWYKEKQYKYAVSETKIVEQEDLSWISPTQENYLTLSTCYPIKTADKRFIVRAKAVK